MEFILAHFDQIIMGILGTGFLSWSAVIRNSTRSITGEFRLLSQELKRHIERQVKSDQAIEKRLTRLETIIAFGGRRSTDRFLIKEVLQTYNSQDDCEATLDGAQQILDNNYEDDKID